jgi:hypothetical protein
MHDTSSNAALCSHRCTTRDGSRLMPQYAGPIYQGTVPPSVLAYLGEYAHILDFSPEERAVLHGSSDFFGWNHYGTQLTSGKRVETSVPRLVSFGSVERVFERDGIPIGVKGEAGHPYDGEPYDSALVVQGLEGARMLGGVR